MKALFFSFVVLFSCTFSTSSAEVSNITTCPAPTNLAVTSQSHNAISFDWDDCNCSLTEYQVYFVVNGQASFAYSTNKSDIAFSGLSVGTYVFHFYTVCGGESSSIIIEEVIIG